MFARTVVPRDFDIVDVRFEERGGAELVKGGRATGGALPQKPADEVAGEREEGQGG